mgnify:CR=1 FL=1|jgi:hypothetical protein
MLVCRWRERLRAFGKQCENKTMDARYHMMGEINSVRIHMAREERRVGMMKAGCLVIQSRKDVGQLLLNLPR